LNGRVVVGDRPILVAPAGHVPSGVRQFGQLDRDADDAHALPPLTSI
jgi:hypothetical protein